MKTTKRLDNSQRAHWIDTIAQLRDQWQQSGLEKHDFIRQNRRLIDETIRVVRKGILKLDDIEQRRAG